MAIVRSNAEVQAGDGATMGRGIAYIHLPRGHGRAQDASGTVSLREWNAAAGEPAVLLLEDGQTLAIRVSRDALSECSRNRVLRFSADWPG